jgi:hypothetical protein
VSQRNFATPHLMRQCVMIDIMNIIREYEGIREASLKFEDELFSHFHNFAPIQSFSLIWYVIYYDFHPHEFLKLL